MKPILLVVSSQLTKGEKDNLSKLLLGVNQVYSNRFEPQVIDLKDQKPPATLPDLTFIFGHKAKLFLSTFFKDQVDKYPSFSKVKDFWDDPSQKKEVWEAIKNYIDSFNPKVKRVLKREEVSEIMHRGLLTSLEEIGKEKEFLIKTNDRVIRIVNEPQSENDFSKEEFVAILGALLMFNAKQIDIISEEKR